MKTSSLVLLVTLAALGAGCENVAAYQRGKLAHPTMALEEPTGVAASHVQAIQEGAQGGSGGAGGGCGCN